MTRDALIARALLLYPFRPRRVFDESPAAYLVALIDHVEDRDASAAHELRVGREQSAWTAEDVAAFFTRMTSTLDRPPRETLRPGTAIAMLEAGRVDPTEDALVDLAGRGLAVYVDDRLAHPTRSFPIMVHVVLTDGTLRIGTVNRGDRVAIVTALARTMPVFGFIVIADAFIHAINDPTTPRAHAEKTDAFIAHIGTRDLRRMMVRPYRVVDGRTEFLDPPPDVDKRGPETLRDPYAGVFATPPTPGARVS